MESFQFINNTILITNGNEINGDNDGDRFGKSLALNCSGNTIVIEPHNLILEKY